MARKSFQSLVRHKRLVKGFEISRNLLESSHFKCPNTLVRIVNNYDN